MKKCQKLVRFARFRFARFRFTRFRFARFQCGIRFLPVPVRPSAVRGVPVRCAGLLISFFYLKATPLPPAPWPAGGREGSNLVTRCHTSITRRLSFKLSRRWPTAWLQTSAWRILQRCNCVHENLRAMEPLLGAVLGRSWGAPLQAAKLEDVHANFGVLGERVGAL